MNIDRSNACAGARERLTILDDAPYALGALEALLHHVPQFRDPGGGRGGLVHRRLARDEAQLAEQVGEQVVDLRRDAAGQGTELRLGQLGLHLLALRDALRDRDTSGGPPAGVEQDPPRRLHADPAIRADDAVLEAEGLPSSRAPRTACRTAGASSGWMWHSMTSGVTAIDGSSSKIR